MHLDVGREVEDLTIDDQVRGEPRDRVPVVAGVLPGPSKVVLLERLQRGGSQLTRVWRPAWVVRRGSILLALALVEVAEAAFEEIGDVLARTLSSEGVEIDLAGYGLGDVQDDAFQRERPGR